MARERLCRGCRHNLEGRHKNALRCRPCASAKRHTPAHNLTLAQQKRVCSYVGKLKVTEIAAKVGVSRASLLRFRAEANITFKIIRYTPQQIAEVSEYYEHNGRIATAKKFPKLVIRSLIERHYIGQSRQIKWSPKQLHQAAKWAGLITRARQAEKFNRPNAKSGSIHSLWNRKMRIIGSLHGLRTNRAKWLLSPGFPMVLIATEQGTDCHRLCLWCDAVNWLPEGTPPFLREAIRSMADFQFWLFAPAHPGRAIRAILAAERRAAS